MSACVSIRYAEGADLVDIADREAGDGKDGIAKIRVLVYLEVDERSDVVENDRNCLTVISLGYSLLVGHENIVVVSGESDACAGNFTGLGRNCCCSSDSGRRYCEERVTVC